MLRVKTKAPDQSGFTLIELLVVTGIIAALFGLVSVNLGVVQTNASLSSATNSLLSDLKNQQILAMTGSTGGTISQQPQGIYIDTNSYVLFSGTSYNSADPHNFTVSVNPIRFSTTLPLNQVIFNKGTGDVNNYIFGNNFITLIYNGSSNQISINRFGAVSVN